MRIPALRTLLLLLSVGGVALAQDEPSRWSLQFGVGRTLPLDSETPARDIRFEDGYSLWAGLRRDMGPLGGDGSRLSWAYELEVYFQDHEIESDPLIGFGSSSLEDTSTVAVMVNAILNLKMTEKVSWYGGLGIGYAPMVDVDSRNNGPSNFELKDDNGFAVQGKAGIEYQLGGSVSWTLGYRYFQTEDLDLEDVSAFPSSFEFENRAHVLELGVRWRL